MKPSQNPFKQFRSIRSALLFIAVVSSILLGMVLVLHAWKGIPYCNLTRDPVTVLRGAVYIGFLSQAGIFLWAAAAGICLFAAFASPKNHLKSFLIASGLLSLLLGFDDAFLLHEKLLPQFGIPEKIVYGTYALIFLIYLLRYQAIIRRTEYLLLGMAFLFFGCSVALDQIVPNPHNLSLWEDGSKIIGIVCWLTYFFRVGTLSVNENQEGL